MLEFDRVEQRKARKKYACQLCGKPILCGAEYIYESLKYDGNIATLRRHIHCDALLDVVLPRLPDTGEYSDEAVTEELRDTCAALHEKGVCEGADYDVCEDCDCYGCYLVLKEELKNPVIYYAAIQSVQNNSEM